MTTSIHARDIMTTRLVTLRAETDVFEAIELLLKNRISGAPVVNASGDYLGVFSERNCLSIVVNSAYDQLPSTEVSGCLTTDNPTITEETDVLSIAQVFLKSNARRLPVLLDGKLVGQVSRRDVLRGIHQATATAANSSQQLLYLSSLVAADQAPV